MFKGLKCTEFVICGNATENRIIFTRKLRAGQFEGVAVLQWLEWPCCSRWSGRATVVGVAVIQSSVSSLAKYEQISLNHKTLQLCLILLEIVSGYGNWPVILGGGIG